MKSILSVIVLVLVVVVAGCGEKAMDGVDGVVQRVGVYDSRAVVVGYVSSDVYKRTQGAQLEEWIAKLAAAKAAGDEALVKELKAKGSALQDKRHAQGFDKAPIDDVLAYIPDEIEDVKREFGVDLLVSKWDTKAMKRYQDVEQVDVTMALIEAFGPVEKQVNWAKQMMEVK